MTRCLVIDIETRINRLALAASGRRSAPRDMPASLQEITALAMLSFVRDSAGTLSDFKLVSHGASGRGEAAVASAAEVELRRLHTAAGELITFNGNHDLGVLRIALLSGRAFYGGGVASWFGAPPTCHRDLMLEISGGGRRSRLADLAARLGFASPAIALTAREAGGEIAKAELDVCLTTLLYIHLFAERGQTAAATKPALLAFGRFLAKLAPRSPHLAGLLRSPLYAQARQTLSS